MSVILTPLEVVQDFGKQRRFYHQWNLGFHIQWSEFWMFLWKFVVMWMLQVVYRVHYVLWCCLVCLLHYFCLHTPDYSVGKVEWERKKKKERKLSFSFNFNNFPPFLSLSFNDFHPHDFSFPFQLFQPTSALSFTSPQLLAKNKFQRGIKP